MEPLIVVGFRGASGVGKDVAVAALDYERGCWPIALADGIKSALDDLDGRTREVTKRLEKAGISRRMAWQRIGTESRVAARNRRLWTSLALAKIHFLAHLPEPFAVRRFAIPDFRADVVEEACFRAALPAWGGRFGLARVLRPGAGPLPGEAGRHSSEHAWAAMTPDATIHNEGSLADLRAAAVLFFDEVAAGLFDRDPRDPMRRATGLAEIGAEELEAMEDVP
jgi:hypothetical protein